MGYGFDDREPGLILGRDERFLYTPNRPYWLWAPSSHLVMNTRCPFLRLKRRGPEVCGSMARTDTFTFMSRDRLLDVATSYEPDSPGIESRQGQV